METHLKRCQNITVNDRKKALEDHDAYKENNPSRARQTGPANHVAIRGSRRLVLSSSATFNHQLQASSSESSLSSFSPSPLKCARTTLSSLDDVDSSLPVFTAAQQKEFNDDLCRVFVSCGFAWRAVDDPEMHIFMKKWVGAEVTDRKALGGRILDSEVQRVEARTRQRVEGKVGTGQCDGWKNVAKTSVCTSMITVEKQVSNDY